MSASIVFDFFFLLIILAVRDRESSQKNVTAQLYISRGWDIPYPGIVLLAYESVLGIECDSAPCSTRTRVYIIRRLFGTEKSDPSSDTVTVVADSRFPVTREPRKRSQLPNTFAGSIVMNRDG